MWCCLPARTLLGRPGSWPFPAAGFRPPGLPAAACRSRPLALSQTGPGETVQPTEDQTRHGSRAATLTRTNQTSFILPLPCVWETLNFFPLKILFLTTWCLLLLLLTAESDLLEPVVACIFVYLIT